MNVLIINGGIKPVPAVSGGGVEMLIDLFISQHKSSIPKITVATIANDESKKYAKVYKNIDFIFLNNCSELKTRILKLIYHFIYRFYSKPIGNAFIHSIGKQINFTDYDLVIVENGISFGTYIRRKFRGKLVLHLHNDWINIRKRFSKEYANAFDEIWTISDFIKKQVDEVGSTARTKVLYNGVDFQKFDRTKLLNSKVEVRSHYGIKKDDFVFSLCSRIVEEKGILQAQEAFKRFTQKFNINNVKLMIIGKMSNNDYCSMVYDKSDNNTIVLGYIEHNDLPGILVASDVCLTPTVHFNKYVVNGHYCGVSEGLNVTVIEALALGIPVIATDSGGMIEIVKNGYNGYIVSAKEDLIVSQLEDAMMAIYMNYDKLRENSTTSVKKFSKESYYSTFYSYITTLLGELKL